MLDYPSCFHDIGGEAGGADGGGGEGDRSNRSVPYIKRLENKR